MRPLTFWFPFNESESILAPGRIICRVLYRIYVLPLARRQMVANKLDSLCNEDVKVLLLISDVSQHSRGVRMVHELRIAVNFSPQQFSNMN